MLRIILAIIGLAISGLFLANPGAGALFEIPDILPGVGNLDEVFFSGVFFYCLGMLGINIMPHRAPKQIGEQKSKEK